MRSELTPRQQQILQYIRACLRQRGYPPSVREIGQALGLRSSATVHAHLRRLIRKGYLRRDPAKPRALVPAGPGPAERSVPVPVLGRVAAGPPLLAQEEVESLCLLPYTWVGGEEAFWLRVQGDSMAGAGIHHGDLVLVRRQDHARPGDIVVALVEGEEATVKRYFPQPGGIVCLRPENPSLEPLCFPAERVRILGRVVGVFRPLP